MREEDVVSHLFVASTHAYILIFSDKGRVYWLKVYAIPDVGPDGKGKAIVNLVSMLPDEKIAALLAVKEFEEGKFVVMGTRRGVVKKTDLTAFRNPRAAGIIAMGVEDEDAVIAVQVSDGNGEIFIGTRDGMAIRFPEADVRSTGRGRLRGPGHHPAGKRRGRGHGSGHAGRDRPDRLRERVRQADGPRRISRAVKGRFGYHQHPHDGPERASCRYCVCPRRGRADAHHASRARSCAW